MMRFIGYGDLASQWDTLNDGWKTPSEEFVDINGLLRMMCIAITCDFVSDFDVTKPARSPDLGETKP